MEDDFKFEWRWCLADNFYFYGEDAWQMILTSDGKDAVLKNDDKCAEYCTLDAILFVLLN